VNGVEHRAVNIRALFWCCDAVVFDLDGTLLQTLHGLHQALHDVLGTHGFAAVSSELVRSSIHTGFAGSVQAALQAVPNATRHHAALLTAYRARYRETMVAQSAVYPGVHEVLQAQRARGCKLAVCTNRDEPVAMELLEGLGLDVYFNALIGLRDDDEPKPHPGLLLRSLKALNIAPGHALMAGDSAADAGCADAAGVPCLVFDGGYGADSLPPAARYARFASYGELLQARCLEV
jgi:phosphoglycolate phosphatase